MLGTMKMFCIRMNILSHRNNIVLFLACNMAAVQNLYRLIFNVTWLLGRKDGRFVLNFELVRMLLIY